MKTAIITGASKGIGFAVSRHLASKGYSLVLVARSRDRIKALKKEILQHNNINIDCHPVDIFNQPAVNKVIEETIIKYGHIDLLFNNAGFVKRGTSSVSSIHFEEMVNTNLIGTINMIRSVVPHMLHQQSGFIINMSSRNAKIPRSFLGGYAATKAAILAYSESLYKELSQQGIKVTALCPGFVDTEMTIDVKENRKDLITTKDVCTTIDYLLSLPKSVAIKEICFESIAQVGKYC